jgi:hypothetical protein
VKTNDHHFYELKSVLGKNDQTLSFVRLDESGSLRHDGITDEELFRVLIDRIAAQNQTTLALEGAVSLTHLKTALLWLERNAQKVQVGRPKKTPPHH